MRSMTLERELEAARKAAERAGAAALRRQAQGLIEHTKPDGSPVTDADRENELLIAGLLEEAFPQDGLLGEEGTVKESRSGRRWMIDPIDGTRDFVRGNPVWAILIGLERDGEVSAGVAYFPALQEMYFASRNSGAYRGTSRINASAVAAPSRAVLCISGLDQISSQPFAASLLEWMSRFWAVRSMGGCFDAMLVASGMAEVWIEPRVQEWDLAAPRVILEEAGARFLNFDGRSSIYGGNCIACTPALEPELRRFIAGDGRRGASRGRV